MPATLATFNDVLREDVQDYLLEQFNNNTEIWSKLKQAPAKWAGRSWHLPFKNARNTGIGYRDHNLPVAGQQGYSDFTGTAKRFYGRFYIDNLLKALAVGDQAVVTAMEGEMDGLEEDIGVQLDRSMVSGGNFVGFINDTRTQGGASTWIFDGDYTKLNAAITAGGGTVNVNLYYCAPLHQGGTNGWLLHATSPVAVTAANAATGLITITPALNLNAVVADRDFPVAVEIQTPAVQTAMWTNQEVVGLYGQFGNPVHFSENRTTATGFTELQPSMRNVTTVATVATGARVPLARTHMSNMMSHIFNRTGMKPDEIWMNSLQVQHYEAILVGAGGAAAYQVSGSGAQKGDAGFTGYSYGGVPIMEKRHVDNGQVLFMKFGSNHLALATPPTDGTGGFASPDGNVLSRVAGEDRVEGYWRAYHELVMRRPNIFGYIGGLTY